MNKICKFYMENNCKKGDSCDFVHDNNICKDWWFNKCNIVGCNFKHGLDNKKGWGTSTNISYINNKDRISSAKILSDISNKRKKNTETFKPNHSSMDMKIILDIAKDTKYTREIYSNEVIILKNLFCNDNDLTMYNNLLSEINNSGICEDELWKLWHGDTHLIADDKKCWKEKCPLFSMVIEKIQNYFDMDIKATRFNWYRNSDEWKPFHHDASAVKADKAETQNFTVAVSFGCDREAAFEHTKNKTKISIPISNGTIYIFSKDINIDWRHGILQVPPDKKHSRGRISLIMWGWVRMSDK